MARLFGEGIGVGIGSNIGVGIGCNIGVGPGGEARKKRVGAGTRVDDPGAVGGRGLKTRVAVGADSQRNPAYSRRGGEVGEAGAPLASAGSAQSFVVIRFPLVSIVTRHLALPSLSTNPLLESSTSRSPLVILRLGTVVAERKVSNH